MNTGGSSDTFYLIRRRIWIPKADVVDNRIREELGFLKDVGDLATQAFHADVFDVNPINLDLSFRGGMEAWYQVRKAGLAGAGWPNERDNLADVSVQANVLERAPSVRIDKTSATN